MNIYHFETKSEDQQLLDAGINGIPEFSETKHTYIQDALTSANASHFEDVDVLSVFVNSVVDKEVFDALPNLKLITTRSTGFDHIDVKYAKVKGVAVCNVPAYGSRTVAEFTFALMLGLSRKVFQANFHIKTGQTFDYEGFEGFNLQGKTLGILGTGRIGLEVAKIAKGFDMHIVAFDAYPNPEKAARYGFSYLSLPELLQQSDIVTVHVPYNEGTHHLINQSNIETFKTGALLINTSRGEVLDTEALLFGLQSKHLAGAALDVLEGEHELKEEMQLTTSKPHHDKLKILLDDHILMNMPQVLITPHMAFFTKEAKQEIAKITLENIESFLAGTPVHIVS